MTNIKNAIQNYNPNLLSKHITPAAVCSCSCHKKSECLLDNECLSESLILKAATSQTSSQISKYNYGMCAKTFKEQYKYHTVTKQKSTELSKRIWKLKQNRTNTK